MSIRCKMKVDEVWVSKDSKGEVSQGNTDENKEWSKWTPSASFEIYINNPAAMDTLAKGHEFYVDFTPAVKS